MEKRKGISVVIPNFNGSLLLPHTLPPLFEALAATGLAYEVILSDDCSTDDSVQWLKQYYPAAVVLESSRNRGFSPTINQGIFAARYDLVLLLNSDVKLTANYFEKQLPYFDEEDTFGVMGRIVGWEDDVIQDGGKYPAFHGAKIKTSGNYIPQDPHRSGKLFSMYLSGANAFVNREKLLALNGFDEIFAPFYVEDFELSLRAWRLGWKCYYEHHAVCRHKTSTTISSSNRKKYVRQIYYRNKMYLHAIHLEGGRLLLWYLQLLPETLIHLVTGRFWYVTSLRLFLSSGKKIKESKKKFYRLAEKHNIQLGVTDIVKTVVKSLQKTAIKRFG